MEINGETISEKKLGYFQSILPENTLRLEYEENKLSGKEISEKYKVSPSWVNKLRKIYNIKTDSDYRLRRNNLRFLSLTNYQKQVLHGTLFGDSCISLQSSGVCYWECMHSTGKFNQEKYLLRKANILNPFISKVSYGSRPFEKSGKLFPYVRARSFALPIFTEYRNKFYPNGIKEITSELLKELTPTGLVYWWMDDGIKSLYGFNIVTYELFFRDNISEATKIFKDTLNLDVSITWYRDEGNICTLKDSHQTMYGYIKSEIASDLIYKLPKRFR